MQRTTCFTKQFFFLLLSLSSPALTSEEMLHINVCFMLIFVVPSGLCCCICFGILLHFIFRYNDMTKVIWTEIGSAASIYTEAAICQWLIVF